MEQLLQSVLTTLNTIHVSGIDDMQKMLGCMEAIKQILALAQCPPESKEKGSEVTDG